MAFVQYFDDGKRAEFNGVTYTRDDRTGYYLSTFKDPSGKRTRLHRDVWAYFNCPVPKGHDVHHIDHDKSNNEPSNLSLMTQSQHRKMHGTEYTTEEYDKVIQNLNENARPAASKWHKSEEGREWHKEHYEEFKDKMHVPRKCICQVCGKEYETLGNGRDKFCSNACKSKWRRDNHLDDVARKCEICGKDFITNKYSKGRFCSLECIRKHKQNLYALKAQNK